MSTIEFVPFLLEKEMGKIDITKYIGKKFGKLIILKKDDIYDGNDIRVICKCDCGNEKSIRLRNIVSETLKLKHKNTKSCGCWREHGCQDRIIGKKYNLLTVIERINKTYKYLCQCDCGNKKIISSYSFKSGRTKSCGCLLKKMRCKTKQDLVGKSFNLLTVIKRDSNLHKWVCQCQCGKKTFVPTTPLVRGRVKSCGCLSRRKELTGLKFGRLLVLEKAQNKGDKTCWLCKCDCGRTTIVRTVALKEVNGTKSCGCLINEKNKLKRGEASFNSLYSNYLGSARRRDLDFNLNKEEVRHFTKQNCYYCNLEPKKIIKNKYANGGYEYNGIDRIDNNIGYELKNCVPCCSVCNMMKKDYNIDDFLKQIDRIHNCCLAKKL